jgi:hypothetical protein
MACSADPRSGDGVVVSARYRKDEQALVRLTRRSGRSPRSALGTVTTVITSAALPFVPDDDLQAAVYGAYRNLRNQAATSEGAKR